MKVRKTNCVAMHSINIWGLDGWIAETREIAVSNIVSQNKDDVRLSLLRESRLCEGNRRRCYMTSNQL